jgi:hypothetical protein
MPRKRRRVASLQPGERRQYQPGELANGLPPALREQIEELAVARYAAQGRGVLMVVLDGVSEAGIASTEYVSLHDLAETDRGVPFAEMQPAAVAVRRYDPEREFMLLVLDVTPGLPAPQLWFDLCPRTGNAAGAPSGWDRTAEHRDATMNAYAAIEALAREGYAAQGRGFVFHGVHTDGETEPYVAYLTLDRSPGDGFAASAPDLVAYVRTYDPRTSFVIFDAVVNLEGEQLEQVKIDVWTFMSGTVVRSA